MMPQPMQLVLSGPVATLTLDDGRGNAIGFAFLEALERALTEARDAQVLVMRGRERLFCGGLDLPSLVPLDAAQVDAFLKLFDQVHEQLLAFPRPIVTCARGSAVAGGAILLCAGDVRLATENGKVGINEVALGLSFPTAALEIVRVALGDQRLAEAATFGKLYEGAERLRMGFVTETVAADRIDARAQEIAATLAMLEPNAVAYVREQVRRPALDRVRAHAEADRARFIDRWLLPSTQQRLQSLVARLANR
jgi:enoyl-CoA hydratase